MILSLCVTGIGLGAGFPPPPDWQSHATRWQPATSFALAPEASPSPWVLTDAGLGRLADGAVTNYRPLFGTTPDALDAAGGRLVAGFWPQGRLAEFDPAGRLVRTIPLAAEILAPKGLYVTGNRLIVFDASDTSLALVDRATGRFMDRRALAITDPVADFTLLDSLVFTAGRDLIALTLDGLEIRRWPAFELGCFDAIDALESGAGSTLLIGCDTGAVLRFNPLTGTVASAGFSDARIIALASADPADLIFKDGFESIEIITLIGPPNGAVLITPNITLDGEVRDDVIGLTIDGAPVDITGGVFSIPVTLAEGENSFLLAATTTDGLMATLLVLLMLDTVPPDALNIDFVDVSPPQGGITTVTGFVSSVEANAEVRITNDRSGQTITVQADGKSRFGGQLGAVENDTLTLVARDQAGNLSLPRQAVVPTVNDPPVLDPIGPQSVELGSTLTFAVTAGDPDGDELFLAADPLPQGATLDAMTGAFRFRPAAGQTGDFDVLFQVSDGEFTDNELVTITVNVTDLGFTRMSGRVLDVNDFTATGTETPVVGAAVSILDSGQNAATGGDGAFVLDNLPGGAQIFDIDPSGAQPAPDGAAYAGFREAIELIPNVDNVIERPFFLPRLDAAGTNIVDPNALSIIRNDTLGMRIEIPPHTAKAPDGSDYAGPMSISLVPDAVAPAALPENLGFGLLITIQPVGVYFDRPVPIFFPNNDGWPEGAEADIWSLDPNLGEFAVVGTARVVGGELRTVAGGVMAADWHGFLARQLILALAELEGCDVCARLRLNTGSETVIGTGALRLTHGLATYRALEQDIGLTLVYNSQEAYPQPVVTTGATIPILKPGLISARLSVNGIAGPETVYATTGLQFPDRMVVAGRADAAVLPTGVYPYRLDVTSHFQFSRIATQGRGAMPIVNRGASPIGAGWSIDGLARIHEQFDGSLLRVDGGGTARLFRAQRAGTGRFAGARAFWSTANTFARSIRNPMVADFNGDGVTDFAFADGKFSAVIGSDLHVELYFGDGFGEFARARFNLAEIPIASTPALVNNDAFPDIVVCGIDHVDAFLNDGAGGFGANQRFNTNNIQGCENIAAGDFNGDGFPDFAYPERAAANTGVGVLLSTGALSYDPQITLTAGAGVKAVAAGLFNNDANLDLVTANSDADTVTVFMGDGLGGFGAGQAFPAGNGPNAVAAGDLNGDGFTDLAVAARLDDKVSILINDGAGGFGTRTETATGRSPFGIALGDFDADGRLDVVTTSPADGTVSVLLNNGLGGFPQRTEFLTQSVPEQAAAADLDGDGNVDVLTTANAAWEQTAALLKGLGDGSLSAAPTIRQVDGNGIGRDLAIADFDGDFIPDVAAGKGAGSVIEIYSGTGGGFRAPPLRVSTQSGNNGGHLEAADVDLDGDTDLITVGNSPGNRLISVLNNGDGTFQDGAGVIGTALGGLPEDVESGDLDGDGYPDAVVLHRNAGNASLRDIAVFRGTGAGAFALHDALTAATGLPIRIAAADVDRDGDLDVLTLTGAEEIAVYPNNGFGRLGAAVVSSFPAGNAQEFSLADFNGDGILDVVYSDDSNGAATQRLVIAIGGGAGTFAAPAPGPQVCDLLDSPLDVVPADLDGDGDTDFAVSCADDSVIEILINDGAGAFANFHRIQSSHRGAGGTSPGDIGFMDFNRDGALDLVALTNAGLQFHAAFPGNAITGYRSPAGEFATLVKNPGGTFTQTDPGGLTHAFDAQGRLVSLTDRNGNVTAYGYDGAGRLTGVTDPAGNATTLTYTGGRLSAVTDPAGRVTAFQHDAAGNLTAITDPDATTRTFAYDASHRLIRQTGKRGFVTEYRYDASGLQRRVTRPDGSINRIDPAPGLVLVQSAAGPGTFLDPLAPVQPEDFEARLTDATGNVWRYRTDGQNAMTRRIDPLGNARTVVRDANFLPIRIIDDAGVVTAFGYDQDGNTVSIVEALGLAEERVRRARAGAFGLPVEIVDAAGNGTRIERDVNGNITRIVDAAGEQTLIVSNARGLPATITDRNGHMTQFTYDADFNRETVTNAAGVVTRITRDADGNITRVVEAEGDPLERATDLTYDALNRVTASTDALGNIVTAQYDAAGNRIRINRPDRDPVTLDYDERNRVVALGGSAIPRTTEYDGNGQVTRQQDAPGAAAAFQYDAAGRMVAQLGPLGRDYFYEYDARGRLTRLVDARGQERTFSYDALGRNIAQTNALGETRFYEYDTRDNIVRLTRAGGSMIDYQYDALSRLVQVAAPGDTLTFGYDPENSLILAADADSSAAFVYDNLNRLVETSTSALGAQPASTLTFAWDNLGRRLSRQDSLGGIELYGFDAADLLTQLTPAAGGAIFFTHNAQGDVTRIDFPNGVSSSFTVNANGLLTGAAHALGAAPLVTSLYSFDERRLLTRRTDNGAVTDFTYDALNQLTAAAGGRTESYAYDLAGNRTASHLSAGHVVDAVNRLLQDDDFDYLYDADGRLQSRTARAGGAVRDYTFDDFGRLIRVDLEGGGFAEYAYDALGRRIRKNVDGNVTRYVYDGENIALEFDGAATLLARYSHGPGRDMPAAQVRGGMPFYYHHGQLGHVRLLTDAGGAVVNQYDYDSYGNPLVELEAVANPYRYSGREWDAETGHYYYRARYYDPQSGRFLSEDPLGANAGDPNFYRYVFDSPLNLRDPDGELIPLLLVIGAVAVLGSGGIKAAANNKLRVAEQDALQNAVDTLSRNERIEGLDPEQQVLLDDLRNRLARCKARAIIGAAEDTVRNVPGSTANFPQTSVADVAVGAATSPAFDAGR